MAANWLGWGLLLVKGRDGVLGEEWHGGELGEGQGPAGPGPVQEPAAAAGPGTRAAHRGGRAHGAGPAGTAGGGGGHGGRAIEELHGEGLKIAEIAAWCGGLSAAELNRLRAAARPQPTSPDTDAAATQGAASGLLGDADAPDAAGAAASHPMSGRDQAGAGADEPVAGPSASGL